MDLIITYVDISQKIFQLIDKEDLLKYRLVSKIWKTVIDDPIFWLRKLECIDEPITARNEWLVLLQKSKEFEKYEESLKLCIIRKYINMKFETDLKWKAERVGLPAIYYAIYFGMLEVVKLIHEVDNNFHQKSYRPDLGMDFTYPLISAIEKCKTDIAKYIILTTKVLSFKIVYLIFLRYFDLQMKFHSITGCEYGGCLGSITLTQIRRMSRKH